MVVRTFLLWFELPSELDAPEGTPYLSDAERQSMLEVAIREDPRWVLERMSLSHPAGHDERQSLLVFVRAEQEAGRDVEETVRAGVFEVIEQRVPGARLMRTMDVTDQPTPR